MSGRIIFSQLPALLSSSLQPDINQENPRAISAKTEICLPDNSVSSFFYNILSGDGICRENAIALIILRRIHIVKKNLVIAAKL